MTTINQISTKRNEKTNSTNVIDELELEISKILDIDELDAHIYLNLLRMGPVTASSLAKEINIDRTKAYRTIEKLTNLKVVSTTFSKPKLCVANKPEDVIKNVLQKKETQVNNIRDAKKHLVDRIKKMLIAELRFGGTVYNYAGTAALDAQGALSSIPGGTYDVWLTDDGILDVMLTEGAAELQPGQTATVVLALDTDFKTGRDTQFKLTTTNGAVFVGTVVIGQQVG